MYATKLYIILCKTLRRFVMGSFLKKEVFIYYSRAVNCTIVESQTGI